MNVVFVFFEKTLLSVKLKVVKKMTCWNKKGLIKKIYTMLKMIKKRRSFFYEKMFVRIKDDRDSVTRPKSEN